MAYLKTSIDTEEKVRRMIRSHPVPMLGYSNPERTDPQLFYPEFNGGIGIAVDNQVLDDFEEFLSIETLRKSEEMNRTLLKYCVEGRMVDCDDPTLFGMETPMGMQPNEERDDLDPLGIMDEAFMNCPAIFGQQMPTSNPDHAYLVYDEELPEEDDGPSEFSPAELREKLGQLESDYCRMFNVQSVLDFDTMEEHHQLMLAQLFHSVIRSSAMDGYSPVHLEVARREDTDDCDETCETCGGLESKSDHDLKSDLESKNDDESKSDHGSKSDDDAKSDDNKSADSETKERFSRNNPKYRTVLCNKYSITGICPYGNRCQFIHQYPPPPGFGLISPKKSKDSYTQTNIRCKCLRMATDEDYFVPFEFDDSESVEEKPLASYGRRWRTRTKRTK